jgi:hypothetical protein
MALLPSIGAVQTPVKIRFNFFFDKPNVASHLSKAKRAGLYKTGSVVMQIARRSIKKMGMAKPKLKQMTTSPGSLSELLRAQEATIGSASTSKRQRALAERARQRLADRMFEMKFRPASPAGTPPHTHLGTLRNAITYAFDPSTESVVVGGFMPGINAIVSLHEFGGWQTMQAWAWTPAKNKRNPGIIGWWAVGRKPRWHKGRWTEMGSQWRKAFPYPERPYMGPALIEGIRRKRIPEAFRNSVKLS